MKTSFILSISPQAALLTGNCCSTSRKNPLFGCPDVHTYLNLVVAQIKLFQSWDRLETLGAADSVAAHVQLLQAR